MSTAWELAWSEKHRRWFYQNHTTGESSWSKPPDCDIKLPTEPPPRSSHLPSGWEEAFDSKCGKPYFFNRTTGERTWTRPRPDQEDSAPSESGSASVESLPSGWEEAFDSNFGRPYFFNRTTGERTWQKPRPDQEDSAPSAVRSASDGPLPSGWEEAFDSKRSKPYFFNRTTGERTWTRPKPEPSSPLAPGWEEAYDTNFKRAYYFKRSTGERTWIRPVAQYEWKHSDGWTAYKGEAANQIAEALHMGREEVSINIGGKAYVVDLKNMVQRNVETGARRTIRVSPSPAGAGSPSIPALGSAGPHDSVGSRSVASKHVRHAVQRLMDHTWRDVTTRDRSFKQVQRFETLNVLHNENPHLWDEYCRAKARVQSETVVQQSALTAELEDAISCLGKLDASINEFLLFHGTQPTSADRICREGFLPIKAGSRSGLLYGPGMYFAENSSKSDEYAEDDKEGIYQGLYAMLLCRVTCGNLLVTEDPFPDAARLHEECHRSRYHSILGDRVAAKGTYREFVLLDTDFVYPEYVIIYRRKEDND